MMDSQSREFRLELNETILELDSESEEFAHDTVQTGGDLSLAMDSGISEMDSQSREYALELNETIVQLDSESEDVAHDTTQTSGDLPMELELGISKMDRESRECPLELNDTLQTGGHLPMEMDSGVSNDICVEVPKLGMVFQSDDQAYEFYNQYAKSTGFSVRKSSSTHRTDNTVSRRVFCCSKEGVRGRHPRGSPRKARPETRTDCRARFVIKIQNDGSYAVVNFIEEHNHELAPPSEVHMLRSQRKIQDSQPGVIHSVPYSGVGSPGINSHTRRKAGGSQNLNFMQEDYVNYLQRMRRNKILKKGDAQLPLDHLKCMKNDNPYFFYSIRIDEKNQMCSYFWCDAKSRMDYNFFGDVMCLDTTYRTNDNDRPYALFVGVNNHGQSILFGYALLLDESTDSFVWLFQTFLDAMNGKQPKTIFTHQATSIAYAISRVLPSTYHRLCLRHIYQNAMKQLSDVSEKFVSFANDFRSCIYNNETKAEFQSNWDVLLYKYKLTKNECLRGLYQMREKWAPAYGREHFSADMTTAQRNKGMKNFLKKYFKRTMSLGEFVIQYERALTSQRENEKRQDFISTQTKPNLNTIWPAEAQAAERYTRKIFMLFQDEYVGTLDLYAEVASEDGTIYTYKVSSFGNIRPHTVTFDSLDNTVKCSCKKFEFVGILCAHALKILHSKKFPDLPSQYYLNRWTKAARASFVIDDRGKSVYVDWHPSLPLQYSELAHIALALSMTGASTEDCSAFAKQVLTRGLGEVDNFLKADPNQARPFEEIRSVNHENVGDETVTDHLGANISMQGPPRKKAKGQQNNRHKGALETARGKKEAQARRTGTGGQSGQVLIGAIEIASRPPMAFGLPSLLFIQPNLGTCPTTLRLCES